MDEKTGWHLPSSYTFSAFFFLLLSYGNDNRNPIKWKSLLAHNKHWWRWYREREREKERTKIMLSYFCTLACSWKCEWKRKKRENGAKMSARPMNFNCIPIFIFVIESNDAFKPNNIIEFVFLFVEKTRMLW